MKRYILATLLAVGIVLTLGADNQAQITVVTPPLNDGVYVLRIANGQASLAVGVQPNVGPVVDPVIPGPVVPVTTDLTSAAAKAIAEIPAYADKATHIKQLAFAMNLATTSFKGSGKPNPDAIDAVQGFLESAVDKTTWAPFFAAVNPHLKASTTYDALRANYRIIVAALESAMPDSALEGGETLGDVPLGIPTYGLQADGANGEWLAFLMQLMTQLPALLELIVKIMAIF